ncbi:MAG TPA: phage shock protein A [Firmicutes bacterium]|nr:phage shock protein A [Bacillota bacterium]
MSILKRFTDIMSANVNALLDKCEDPAKMVDQILRNLNDDLGKVKAETAAIMAEERKAFRELEACKTDVNKMLDYAKRAIEAGSDEDARVFLNKKVTLVEKQSVLQQKYNLASSNAKQMRQMHDKLVAQISELNSRRESIKAKVATANLQTKINKIGSSVEESGATLSAFEHMEEKANQLLDQANAMAELNAVPIDETDALMSKYNASNSSVDNELAALKRGNTQAVDTELATLKNQLNA